MGVSRHLAAALAAVVVVGGLTMGAALAVDDPGAATYTGCLNPSNGTLSNFQAGSTPVKKCAAGDTVVQLGGGDITSVAAGTGLTGGATSGGATLELAGSYRLPQNCTAPNVVAKWSGTAWECAPDDNTTYDGSDFATSNQACTAGQVVTGVGANGAVTCAPDKDTTYDGTDFATSNQACTTGKVVTGVGANGAVTCAPDKDTTYDGSDFATSNQACTTGQVVTGVSASGALTCTSLPASGSSVVRGTYRNGGSGYVRINHYTKGMNEIGSVDLPSAGAWMITVTGVVANSASSLLGGNDRSTYCDLLAPGGSMLQRTGVNTSGSDNDGPLGIQFAGTLAAGHYGVVCETIGGAEDNTNTGVLWLQVNAQSFASVS